MSGSQMVVGVVTEERVAEEMKAAVTVAATEVAWAGGTAGRVVAAAAAAAGRFVGPGIAWVLMASSVSSLRSVVGAVVGTAMLTLLLFPE